MNSIARILLVLVAAFMLITAGRLMFDPVGTLISLELTASSIEGLSHIRSLWAGAIGAVGISVLIAAIRSNIEDARPAVLFVILLLIGRVVSVFVEGMPSAPLVFFLPPIIVLVILITAHKLMDAAEISRAKDG